MRELYSLKSRDQAVKPCSYMNVGSESRQGFRRFSGSTWLRMQLFPTGSPREPSEGAAARIVAGWAAALLCVAGAVLRAS